MAISDIFTTPFLICLGVCLVIVGLFGMYFAQKLMEQNHKITSMFDIVNSMANEMNYVRARLSTVQYSVGGQSVGVAGIGMSIPFSSQSLDMCDNLIHVSDDDDSENDSESDSDSDSDSESESESDSDIDDTDKIILSEKNNIKIINIGEKIHFQEESINDIDEDIEEIDGLDVDEVDEVDDVDEDVENINVKEIDISVNKENMNNMNNMNDMNDMLKSIHMSMTVEQEASTDYKKMSLQKLKNLVAERNLVSDSARLKKVDLLKLLGVDA